MLHIMLHDDHIFPSSYHCTMVSWRNWLFGCEDATKMMIMMTIKVAKFLYWSTAKASKPSNWKYPAYDWFETMVANPL